MCVKKFIWPSLGTWNFVVLIRVILDMHTTQEGKRASIPEILSRAVTDDLNKTYKYVLGIFRQLEMYAIVLISNLFFYLHFLTR